MRSGKYLKIKRITKSFQPASEISFPTLKPFAMPVRKGLGLLLTLVRKRGQRIINFKSGARDNPWIIQ